MSMMMKKLNLQWDQITMVNLRDYITNHKDKVFHTITLAGVISAGMAGIIWPYHRTLGIILVVTCALCNGVLVMTVLSLCCAACVEHYVDKADAKGLGRMCKELSYCCCGCCWYCYEENFKGGETLLLNEEVSKSNGGIKMGGRVSYMEKGSSQTGNGYTKLVSTTEAIEDQEKRLSEDQALRSALDDLREPNTESSFLTKSNSPYQHLTVSDSESKNKDEDPSQIKDKNQIDPPLTAPGMKKQDGRPWLSWAQGYRRSQEPTVRREDLLNSSMENKNSSGLGLENEVMNTNREGSGPTEAEVPSTKL